MKDFEENCCRLCSKTFCCKKCRLQHEEQVHRVNPECEICIYGRTTIKEVSVGLLSHIRSAHWPLHCVFCKKVFTSFDELIPHDKCTVLRQEIMKMQGTPKTPVAEDKDKPSPEVTPFYKSLKGEAQHIGAKLGATAVTSTPLIRKEESGKDEKITPINEIQISNVQKSNIKLTGSSNLSDSKKSERRVTFSETPSVSEYSKKPKYFPLIKQTAECENDSADDSYESVEEMFKTAPFPSSSEEKENTDNQIITFDHRNSDGTLWESALTQLEPNTSSAGASVASITNNLNVSVQINVLNNTAKTDDDSSIIEGNSDVSPLTKSIWTSMTNIVKNVVHNISLTAQNSYSSVSTKRSQPDDGAEAPSTKRIKLTKLKCRRTIRDIGPLYQIRFARPRCVDKATQTDECWPMT